MSTTSEAVEVILDLIEINNDRVAGFEKASKDLQGDDLDLASVFQRYAEQSRGYVAELQTLGVGAQEGDDKSALGAIHRAWIDIKATFSGKDRKSILQECERGEDAIKKAYQSALEDNLTSDVATVVTKQKQGIDAAHNEIKALRDSE